MVKFNKQVYTAGEEYEPESFTVSIEGDKGDYMDVLTTLLRLIPLMDCDGFTESQRYCISNLISGMLPASEQIVSLEDIQELNAIKENNKVVVDTFVKDE